MNTVTNIPGQNSIIERPMPSNITDAARETANRDRLLSTAAFAPALKHYKNVTTRYWDARRSNTNAMAELQQTIVDTKAHRERTIAEYKKTGHKLTPEVTAEDDAIIADAEEEYAARSKKRFPNGDFEEVKRRASKYRNWVPHKTEYFKGDTRHCSEILKDVKNKRRIPAQNKLDVAIQSPRKLKDALESAMNNLRAHADKGKPITGPHIQGFVVDYKGEFQLNTNPKIIWPEEWSKPTQFSDDLAMVDNALDIAIWANFDAFAAAVTKQITAEADDEHAISDADRPAMIAAAKAELLAAQREEEAANKLCERAGIPVFRPNDWPIEVLLEVEAPPKTKPVPVVNAAPVKEADTLEDADVPDFEDAEAEE